MKAKTFNFPKLINAVATYFKKDSNGYFRYGEKDAFPNELITDVNASGTAKSCIIRLDQFTQADGFVNKEVAKKKANPKQSFDDFLSELSLNVVYSKCVSFRVFYNNKGEESRLYATPFTELRKKDALFIWNEMLGTRDYRKTDDKELIEYDPEELPGSRLQRVNDQISKYGKQIGDLVYVFKKNLTHPQYPIPDYYSDGGINDIRSDAALARVDNKNISKGFRTPIIISTGPIDNLSEDEKGKTEQDYFNDSLEKFVGEDAAPILHLYASTQEEMAKVTTIPIADIINSTTAKREDIAKAVCRHFSVPPPIIGIATPGELGNNQQLVNQIKFMGLTVNNNQRMITNALNIVFPGKDFTISTLKLIDLIPPEVMAILTEQEKRDLYDLPQKPVPNEAPQVGI
jgi:hypothetical protein